MAMDSSDNYRSTTIFDLLSNSSCCLLHATGLISRVLETVDLDGVLAADFLLNQKVVHALTLVSLKLDDLAKLGISHNVAVAAEILRKRCNTRCVRNRTR
jgi:hypothetical protein